MSYADLKLKKNILYFIISTLNYYSKNQLSKFIIGIHGPGNKAPGQIFKLWCETAIKEGLASLAIICNSN